MCLFSTGVVGTVCLVAAGVLSTVWLQVWLEHVNWLKVLLELCVFLAAVVVRTACLVAAGNNNNNNERISRALFHVKHAQLR